MHIFTLPCRCLFSLSLLFLCLLFFPLSTLSVFLCVSFLSQHYRIFTSCNHCLSRIQIIHLSAFSFIIYFWVLPNSPAHFSHQAKHFPSLSSFLSFPPWEIDAMWGWGKADSSSKRFWKFFDVMSTAKKFVGEFKMSKQAFYFAPPPSAEVVEVGQK